MVNMGKRAVVSIDWLRKGRMVEDLTILRNIIADSSAWDVETANLDEELFQSRFNLQPLPEEPSTNIAINNAIGYEEVTEKITSKMSPLIPLGDTIRDQVSSLFPANMSSLEVKLLTHVFSRFVLEDTPTDTDWPLVPEGLDSVSAALFTINIVSRLAGRGNPWLLPLWSMKVKEFRLQGLQKIYESLLSERDVEDVVDDIELTKKAINEILIQNPSIERSVAPQDPLSDIIDKWWRTLLKVRDSPRSESDATRQKIADEVLEEISQRKEETETITQWNIHALRPDGPSASDHEEILKMFRENINILDYEPLVKICEYLSNCERAGRPSASEIEQVVGSKRRMSHYTLQRLGLILTERYLPTLSKIGLRYRFVLTEKQKLGITREGLVERMILSEERPEGHSNERADYSGCTVHLEPEASRGPAVDMFPPNTIQMTVDSEIVSMRMDLYNQKNQTWNLEPWKPASRSPGRPKAWLYRETEHGKGPPVKLTDRQIDLIGPLLAFRGLRGARMWMMERMGFVPRTARRYIRSMLDEKLLRLLYTPALEYCGLPEGMIVIAKFKEHRPRESFIDWMTSRIPFTRIFSDKSTNLVAYLRLPAHRTDDVGGVIRGKLSGGKKKDWTTTQSITARLKSYKTYQMTAFQRILKHGEILDPWTK